MILVRRHPGAIYTIKLNEKGEIEDVAVEVTPVRRKESHRREHPRKSSRRKTGVNQRLFMIPAFMGVI